MAFASFLKYVVSIPFRAIRWISNWILSEPVVLGSLEQRFPGVIFQIPKNIFVGERVYIGKDCLFKGKAVIIIGNDTLIAPRVCITTITHDNQKNPMWQRSVFRPVSIGNFVWIGLGALILPGVKISDNAIIGAGSVVTKHVPEGAVVVGNPARIIRYRDIPELDKDIQGKYPYWEDVFDDFLPSDQITRTITTSIR